jgi:hypothetical protein
MITSLSFYKCLQNISSLSIANTDHNTLTTRNACITDVAQGLILYGKKFAGTAVSLPPFPKSYP